MDGFRDFNTRARLNATANASRTLRGRVVPILAREWWDGTEAFPGERTFLSEIEAVLDRWEPGWRTRLDVQSQARTIAEIQALTDSR